MKLPTVLIAAIVIVVGAILFFGSWYQIDQGEEADPVEGFHLFVGGGSGNDAKIGRELFRDIPSNDCPATVERLLKTYLARRAPTETFFDFANRLDIDALKSLVAEVAA